MSSQNGQKNIVFSVLLLVILAASCSLPITIQVNNPQPSTNNPQSNTLPTFSRDPVSIVSNTLIVLSSSSYRKREWVADQQGNPPDLSQTPVLVAEFTPPDNAYVVAGDSEYLALNETTYTRQTGEAWVQGAWDLPGDISYPAATNMAAFYIQALKEGTLTIQAEGNDSIAGVSTQVFIVNGQVDFDGTPMSVVGKVWIADDEKLVKMELDLPDSVGLYYLSLYDYDATIKIPAP